MHGMLFQVLLFFSIFTLLILIRFWVPSLLCKIVGSHFEPIDKHLDGDNLIGNCAFCNKEVKQDIVTKTWL